MLNITYTDVTLIPNLFFSFNYSINVKILQRSCFLSVCKWGKILLNASIFKL